MERIMRAQTFASGENVNMMKAQKTLELNPRHPIITALLTKVQSEVLKHPRITKKSPKPSARNILKMHVAIAASRSPFE